MFKVTGARESFSSSPWPAELADVLGGKLTKQSGNSNVGLGRALSGTENGID